MTESLFMDQRLKMKTFRFLIISGEFLEWSTKGIIPMVRNSTSHCKQLPIWIKNTWLLGNSLKEPKFLDVSN